MAYRKVSEALRKRPFIVKVVKRVMHRYQIFACRRYYGMTF